MIADLAHCGKNQDEDAAYIAHAANLYPALVAALSELVAERANDFHHETEGFNMAREALKQAGELS